jgi:hypothetical protein
MASLRQTESSLFESFLRKRISSIYRSVNRYWSKEIKKLQAKNYELTTEIQSLNNTIKNLITQVPETSEVKESQDSVKSEFSEVISDIVENNEYILEKVLDVPDISPQELFSSDDVSLHQYVPIPSAIKTTDTIDMKVLSTDPFQTDDEIKPTYAEIVKRIPESLKSDQDFKKRVNWMKMNLPNITGIYISRDETCAMCLYSWKDFVRRPDQAIL